MYAPDIVAASALVVLVLIFLRISWTLKEISDSLGSRSTAERRVSYARLNTGKEEKAPGLSADAVIDEKEIAAVIAIASAAMRAAV